MFPMPIALVLLSFAIDLLPIGLSPICTWTVSLIFSLPVFPYKTFKPFISSLTLKKIFVFRLFRCHTFVVALYGYLNFILLLFRVTARCRS